MTDADKRFLAILVLSLIAGLNFGLWQQSWPAGCFMFVLVLHLTVQLQVTRRY
jgi:hypothetical protein